MTTSAQRQTDDDAEWLARSENWRRRTQYPASQRAKRERTRQPLILAGHGVSLRIEGGSLAIRNGFTHYPQKQELHRFFKGDLNLPERIIVIDGSGSISFDVLSWLAEQDVSLIRIDWRGNIVCVAGKSAYAANPYRVQWQRETRENELRRIEFSREIITQKIENSIVTLEQTIPHTLAWELARKSAYSSLDKLARKVPKSIIELMGLEANAAAAYFRAWTGIPIQWRGTNRRPIPENWRHIAQRGTVLHQSGNRNASHPVNTILNYAYTVLESELQIQAIAKGYDPMIGILHESGNGEPAFIFDLIEPHRATVDRKILKFVKENVFDAADFAIRSDGVCRMNPEMARYVAAQAHGVSG